MDFTLFTKWTVRLLYLQIILAVIGVLSGFLEYNVLVALRDSSYGSNVRELGATGMEFSPGWSVGWYFVPIANLWKPFQALKEICQASERPRDWQTGPAPGLLAAWWTLWLVSSVAGRASFRMSLRAEEVGELIAANRVTLVSDLVDIPLSIVFVLIVKAIHDMQSAPPPARVTESPAIDAA